MNFYNLHSKSKNLNLYKELYDKLDNTGALYIRDENGQLHRDEDKPAVADLDGLVMYYKHGKKHRDGGKPAVIFPDGTSIHYKDNIPEEKTINSN